MVNWGTDMPINVAWSLRAATLADPDQAGLAPLNGGLQGTSVQTIFTQMAAAGLPFRISIYAKVEGENDHEEFSELPITLPPITINPRGEENNSFEDLERLTRDTMSYEVECMNGTDTSWTFVAIKRLDFRFVAMNNLAALQARLPPLVGGGKKGSRVVILPEQLQNKKGYVNPPAIDNQCLRMCLIAHFHPIDKQIGRAHV